MNNIELISDKINQLELSYINLYKSIRKNYIASDTANLKEINYILDQLEILIDRLRNEIESD